MGTQWQGRLEQAAGLLPGPLRQSIASLPQSQREQAEEIRLRVGRPLSVNVGGEELSPPGGCPVTEGDLRFVLELASQSSVHTVLDKMRSGFLTVRGGHRIGICGTAVVRGGEMESFRYISSMAIRIAREVRGIAGPLLDRLLDGGRLRSTLILSPPGQGKTTLLRDLIRSLSQGEGGAALRVGVADERGELAATYRGMPQMDLGPRTDVLDGCPKAEGLMLLLRGMNPQVLAVDEITAEADLHALLAAAGCGASLLATAHGTAPEQLARRPLYRTLLAEGLFERFILIEGHGLARRYLVRDGEGRPC